MSKLKISGYTTTRNVIKMNYPFVEAIESMLDFCDEVVVADSSNEDDGTLAKLEDLMNEHDKLEVFHVEVDWKAKNHGIYDGQMKALARSKCTGDYLWQQDVDEIAEPNMRHKLENLIQQASPYLDQSPIICLPVVEYWGSNGKVRIDVNPWKWRLSKNLPNITHGIPVQLRKWEDGLLFAKPGTDGCVTPETKIMTDKGETEARFLKIGDSVLTHNGHFKKITRVFKRPYRKWNLTKIESRNYINYSLRITDNHPFGLGTYKIKRLPHQRILNENISWRAIEDGDFTNNQCFLYPKLRIETDIEYIFRDKTIKPNYDLGFVIGLFLGDGCIVRRTENKNKFKCVSFALSSYQNDIVDKIKNIIKQMFGIDSKIYYQQNKNYWNIVVNDKDFCEFIYNLCKTGSMNKELNKEIYSWNQNAVLGILEGLYQSDGVDTRSGINITMKNGKLLSQIKLLLTKLNLFASIKSYIKKNSYSTIPFEIYQMRITGSQIKKISFLNKKFPLPEKKIEKQNFLESERYFGLKIKNKSIKIYKEEYVGHLYNFEVEDDHSYIANGIVVHNCDYVDKNSGMIIPFSNFVTPQVERLRRQAITDENAARDYGNWMNMVIGHLPTIYHFSWYSIASKILKFKYFWNDSWLSLYNEKKPTGWNPFFADKTLDEVSDEEIRALAKTLEKETGGHIFHTPWNGQKTNHITVERDLPDVVKNWCNAHKDT